MPLQDGSDAVRAAQAAAAKALSGSHGSAGSLARTGSSSSLSGRQQARPRDSAGAGVPLPSAGAAVVRAQPDAPHAIIESGTPKDAGASSAGVAPGVAAPHVPSDGHPPDAGDWATEAQPEVQPAAAASAEEPEAPVTPSLGSEKVRELRSPLCRPHATRALRSGLMGKLLPKSAHVHVAVRFRGSACLETVIVPGRMVHSPIQCQPAPTGLRPSASRACDEKPLHMTHRLDDTSLRNLGGNAQASEPAQLSWAARAAQAAAQRPPKPQPRTAPKAPLTAQVR